MCENSNVPLPPLPPLLPSDPYGGSSTSLADTVLAGMSLWEQSGTLATATDGERKRGVANSARGRQSLEANERNSCGRSADLHFHTVT